MPEYTDREVLASLKKALEVITRIIESQLEHPDDDDEDAR